MKITLWFYATYIENQISNNFLMAIYFSLVTSRSKNSFITASISWVDINTNKTYIFETVEQDTTINLEDVTKTILSNRPSEVVIFTDLYTKGNDYTMNILNKFIACIDVPCIHDKINTIVNENFFKLAYQNTVFQKIFKNPGMLSIIEYLNLENRPSSSSCFCYLLQFCYEHNEKILEGLEVPIFLENTKYLLLINNAIENLNIISKETKNKTSSILNLLNNCKTSIGKRYFKQCLINPLTNVDSIQQRYDHTEYFIKDSFYTQIRVFLSRISDLDRLFKRLIMKTLQPSEFTLINTSLLALKDMCYILETNKFDSDKTDWSNDHMQILMNFIKYYQTQFNFEEMDKVNLNQITKNIFNIGIYPEIDDMQNQLILSENIFENVVLCLNEGNINNNEFKLELNKDNVRSIHITKNRFENLLKDSKRTNIINKLLKEKCGLNMNDIASRPFSSSNKTMLKICFKDMEIFQTNLTTMQTDIKNKICEEYINVLDTIKLDFSNFFKIATNFIGKIDFFSCNAKNAVEKCYSKPVIVEGESFIKAKKIRHPLIEIIQTEIPYIANDIEIGTENNKGMLLYGLNSVGKSSLMKSIGINLILAQAGLYVSAQNFEFSPYDNIFSRIPSGDNIHKGQSTFQVEISELRTILKRSTSRSLIIGDELASGTEHVSAISLVASGVNYLSQKGASFIFATHINEICELESIKN